jgi:hypothetical protein
MQELHQPFESANKVCQTMFGKQSLANKVWQTLFVHHGLDLKEMPSTYQANHL